ncbi:single-stranded dna-binding protein [Pyrrhoderma noxium]|uniref:Single-stranded dna-binding protein n=1 Tax=Pyrrhoderma noxium TaxID=2282107 RepID=A0A286UNA3_9AGAM|nr:single-stranded dna-binding protein [Pyrrhoderma noxium]
MFATIRSARVGASAQRLFSTSARRQFDVAKLTLIGRLGAEPETKTTANGKEYLTYTVATTNFPPPPPNPDGSRPSARTSWHQIFCFTPSAFDTLRYARKGAHVYVECNYELRDPEPHAEPGSPQSHRQIFLRHDHFRILKNSKPASEEEEIPE